MSYNHQGSLRAVVDSNGTIVKEVQYDAFGNITLDTNSALHVHFGFAGGLYDQDTKLTRFGYRDYDAQTGKWTAKDPIGFAGGDTNLYGYVLNDPVNWVDVMGLKINIIGTADEIRYIQSLLMKLSQNQNLKALINEMENSQETFNILFSDETTWYGGGSYDPKDNTCSLSPKLKNENQNDFWYPSGSPFWFNYQNVYYLPEEVLAHELLGHGIDDLRGLGRNENGAIDIANQYRDMIGRPSRNYH